MGECFRAGLEGELAESAFGIGQGTLQQGEEFVLGEGLELEDLRAGDEGSVDEEEGVFGGGSDEADCTAFHVRQEDILLGFIEAVDFIDEEEGGLALVGESV